VRAQEANGFSRQELAPGGAHRCFARRERAAHRRAFLDNHRALFSLDRARMDGGGAEMDISPVILAFLHGARPGGPGW
jgi:hypothetical protein